MQDWLARAYIMHWRNSHSILTGLHSIIDTSKGSLALDKERSFAMPPPIVRFKHLQKTVCSERPRRHHKIACLGILYTSFISHESLSKESALNACRQWYWWCILGGCSWTAMPSPLCAQFKCCCCGSGCSILLGFCSLQKTPSWTPCKQSSTRYLLLFHNIRFMLHCQSAPPQNPFLEACSYYFDRLLPRSSHFAAGIAVTLPPKLALSLASC